MTSIYGSLFPVPGMGVMPTLINKLNATKTLRPILLILHALCQEALCVSAMAQIPNSIDAFKVLNDSISALLHSFSGAWARMPFAALPSRPSIAPSPTTAPS